MLSAIFMIWFVVSILNAFIGTWVSYFWLKDKGLSVDLFWSTTFGYLEYKYLRWCNENGQYVSKVFMFYRLVSIVNLVMVATIAMVMRK